MKINLLKRTLFFLLTLIIWTVYCMNEYVVFAEGETPSTPVINKLYADKESAKVEVNTKITWTAEADGNSLTYKWKVYKVDKDKNVQVGESDSTASNKFEWTPTQAATYIIKVIVTDQEKNTAEKNSDKFVVNRRTLSLTSLSAKVRSPQGINTSIVWTAQARGESLQYKWEVYKNNGLIKTVAYSTKNTFTWQPNQAGVYNIKVTVKDDKGSTKSLKSANYTIYTPLKIVSLTPSVKSPQNIYTSIRWKANVQGEGIQYSWKIYKNNKLIKTIAFGTQKEIVWEPQEADTYKVMLIVKDKFNHQKSFTTQPYSIRINLDALVKASPVIATYKNGQKVEILQDRDGKRYLVKNIKTGKQSWVSRSSLSIPKDPPTNKKRLSTKLLETYVNQKGFSSSTKYFIWTDLDRQMTYVFYGKRGSWKLIRSMQCATGKNIHPTVRGFFNIGFRGKGFFFDNGRGKVLNNLQITGSYYYHSILYYRDGRVMDAGLGKRKSHGCIRLATANSKWMVDTIPSGTKVWIN